MSDDFAIAQLLIGRVTREDTEQRDRASQHGGSAESLRSRGAPQCEGSTGMRSNTTACLCATNSSHPKSGVEIFEPRPGSTIRLAERPSRLSVPRAFSFGQEAGVRTRTVRFTGGDAADYTTILTGNLRFWIYDIRFENRFASPQSNRQSAIAN